MLYQQPVKPFQMWILEDKFTSPLPVSERVRGRAKITTPRLQCMPNALEASFACVLYTHVQLQNAE